jgi:hypothetical protein
MKTKLLKTAYCCCLLLLFGAGCKKNDDETPPLAASTQTWTFGEQTWSDAIHCPECNKGTFEDSNTDPQCRSYTKDGKTWYYYNWAYVDANKATMCPDPWRVPTKEDFETLVSNTTASTLVSEWGYGGTCVSSGTLYAQDGAAYYWSSTEYDSGCVYELGYGSSDVNPQNYVGKYYGQQVRCVK